MKDWTGNSNSVYKTLGASNHTDKKREENDYYATDPIAIDLLLEGGAELGNKIWECACGEGHLSKRLEELGYKVFSTDLINRGYGKGGVDFLKIGNKVFDGTILTNPPFSKATEFVEKALELIPDGHKVFMFLKLQFLETKKRRELFDTMQLKTVYVCSGRVLCAKNAEFQRMKDGGGSAIAYAWYEFEKGYHDYPIIKWIN